MYYILQDAEGGICILSTCGSPNRQIDISQISGRPILAPSLYIQVFISGWFLCELSSTKLPNRRCTTFVYNTNSVKLTQRLTPPFCISSRPICLPIPKPLIPLPPRPNSLSKLLQDLHGRLPIDARVRNTDALLQRGGAFGGHFLIAFIDVGFDHDADDGRFAFAELVADRLRHDRLVAVVFVRVAC